MAVPSRRLYQQVDISRLCLVRHSGRFKRRASAPGGKLNEATIFHEALHAKSGLQDTSLFQPDLLSIFGFSDTTDPSIEITWALLDNVLGGGPRQCGN